MKILHYDCFSGISGDMNLAAMVDLGVDQSFLIGELKKLDLHGYSILFSADQRKGIAGTRADVVIASHSSHGHEPHSHNNHHERNFAEIKNIISRSTLNDNVKRLSIEIFGAIAEAEAHVHGKPVEEIHFHEVGAVDSIVDIVGAAICFDYLKPDKVISSPVQLGGGFVHCAHGTFPVPAPATLEILKNKPVKMGAVPVETTTPTGAAILSVLVSEYTDRPQLKITKVAYGIGHRDNEIPNVLRVCLAESADELKNDLDTSAATVIECNIDDMNPEMYESVMDRLFATGADDVFLQPVIMKKSRPAIVLSVLCQNQLVSKIETMLLTETSTLGVRKHEVDKTFLKRDWKTVNTRWGGVRVKLAYLNDKIIKSKPEYSDCLEIARTNNIPLKEVYDEVALALLQKG